ncbi:MAG: DUF2066 domain-containing protein [Legionellales bacterium]|nr:DUF2066 domain-containing protein [Legionellales bacterium]
MAKVNVANRSPEAKKVAMSLGLVEVLKRVSSDDTVMEFVETEKFVGQPDKYLQSYGYVEDEDKLFLKMNFNKKQINSILRKLEISPWIKRPEILLWIFIDGRSLSQLGANTSRDIVEMVNQISTKIGLPIYFPLGDLDEEQAFNKDDFVQSQELIEHLSRKYAKEVIVISNMQHTLDGWSISWMLYTQAETQHWINEDASLDLAVKAGFNNMANLLRERTNLSNSYGVTKVKLSVKNISSNDDYKQVRDYLTKLSIVDSVNIVSLKRHDVTFQINLTSDINKFKEVLELNEQLDLINIDNLNQLIYRFKP